MTSTNNHFYQQHCTNNEHRSTITNFCASMECLKPLCPECIQEHYQYHSQSKSPATIQSISNTRINCEKKISAAILSLSKEIEQYDVQYIFNPDEVLDQEIKKMEEAKSQMFQIIELFFSQQEHLLQTKVKENTLKVKNIGGIFQKIQEVIQQLDALKQSLLQSSDPFPFFSKTCRLDVKSLLDRYKSDLKKVIASRELDPIKLHVDEHRLFNLKNELNKIVVVVTQNNEDLEQSQVSGVDRDRSQQPKSQTHTRQVTGENEVVPRVNTHENINEFIIARPNYYSCQQKFLHFFKNNDTKVNIVNLETKQLSIINLTTDQKIPLFHKSISLPNGDIYISGGVIDEKRKESMLRKINVSMNSQSFINVCAFRNARSSHAMVYCNNGIYIIGGYLENKKITNSVEKYNITQQRLDNCASCIYPANSPACCSFNDRYIYKFGGNDDNGHVILVIERYDCFNNKWELIDPQMDAQELEKFTSIYQYASCCQINQNNILVYGGYDQDDKGVNHSFILSQNGELHIIQQVNVKQLLYAEGFWNSQAIIQDRKLYVLQNIEIQDNMVDENNRCLLCFDGNQWNEIQYQYQ